MCAEAVRDIPPAAGWREFIHGAQPISSKGLGALRVKQQSRREATQHET